MKQLTENVSVASNEIVSKFSINRNIKKLLWNDQYIYKMYNKHLKSGPGVFIKGLDYPLGYKIWFRDENGRLGIYTNKVDHNLQSPLEYPDGWANTSVASLPEGESSMDDHYRNMVDAAIDKHNLELHDGNIELVHTNLDNSDFSLYPYSTKYFRSNDNLVTGYARKWKSRILEYLITYRFGEKTIGQMNSSDLIKYFGGMVNSYGTDLKTFMNPTSPEDVNEYFETDVVRSLDIQFDSEYVFDDSSYCIFTSNALDAQGYENNLLEEVDKNNYSPIDTVQIYNKTNTGFSVMRRFNGGQYCGEFVSTENLDDYLKTVYRRLEPADKAYTVYLIGTWS